LEIDSLPSSPHISLYNPTSIISQADTTNPAIPLDAKYSKQNLRKKGLTGMSPSEPPFLKFYFGIQSKGGSLGDLKTN
jgi:hypothetical protein